MDFELLHCSALMFDFRFYLLTLSLFIRFHELAKDIKYNKGGILAATVSYLKMLKMDQIRKNHLEEEVRAQALQNRKLLNKIQVGENLLFLAAKQLANDGHFGVISVFRLFCKI